MSNMSLADAMVRAKVGVGELSRRTGCSTSAIRNYVTEEQRPRIETAAKLVQGLLEEDRQAVLASWGYEGTVERDTVDPTVAVLWEIQAQTKILQALVRDVRTLCVHVQQVATNTDPTIWAAESKSERAELTHWCNKHGNPATDMECEDNGMGERACEIAEYE